MVAKPPTRKRGRPKSTKPVEQQKEERRLKHRQAQGKYHKKVMMMTEKCKKKREARKKKRGHVSPSYFVPRQWNCFDKRLSEKSTLL